MTRQQIIDRFFRSQYLSEAAPVASWVPIQDGFTPHQVRTTHSTLLHDPGTPLRLRDDRMGQISPEIRGMRLAYAGILTQGRVDLRAALQEVWEQALAEPAWLGLRSPVAMLDDFLAPFRDGRRTPIPPFTPGRGGGRVAVAGRLTNQGHRTFVALNQESPVRDDLRPGVFAVQCASPQTESNR
ncbi:hypothetical protein ACIBO2_54690 [Nonomuraea sp. NPDC050022]|uniref:hypothetical protein n=1 Tax=unclassified Nonomuraea TaxID=2593643 RepID=UPI003405EAA6